MPLIADISKGVDRQAACRWVNNTAPDKMVYGPCEVAGRFTPWSSRSIIPQLLPRSEACGPNLATQCLRAIYNRDSHDWSCATKGATCLVPETTPFCDQVPFCRPPEMKMWVEEPGLGPTLVGASAEGEPIWPKVEAEAAPPPLTLGSDSPTLLMYLGLGVLGVLLLLRMRR